MTVIMPDNRKFNIELNADELEIIIDSLRNNSYGVVEFYGNVFLNLIKRLEKEIE